MKKAAHSGAGGKLRESEGAKVSGTTSGGAKKTGTKAGMGMRVDSTAAPIRSGTKAGGTGGMGMRMDESSRPLSSRASYQENLQSYSRRKRK